MTTSPDEATSSPASQGGRRAPTMADIARRAGVSISTVSRVINQNVPVDPVTEARVRAAIEDLRYRPNLLARSFRRRVTHTIGLVVPDNSNPYFAELARVIEDVGFDAGYNVILCNSDLSEAKQSEYIDVLLDKRVDGIILTSTGLISNETGIDTVTRICDAQVPCVVIDRDLGEFPVDQILVDNHEGGYIAGVYLLGMGHRRIACMVGPNDLAPSAGRFAGFQKALAEAGVELDSDLLVKGNGRHDGGVTAVRTLLQRGAGFTAIFAFNDVMAAGAIGALQRAGKQVPRDVSIIGFDDIPLASAMYPSITTIAQPIAEMGRGGVELLLKRIEHPDAPFERVVLPTHLIARESTSVHQDISRQKGGSRDGGVPYDDSPADRRDGLVRSGDAASHHPPAAAPAPAHGALGPPRGT